MDREIWGARDKNTLHPDWLLDDFLVFSVMGDYDSPCYRPAQDVVIPARSCKSISLRENFESIERVKPASERPHLITWSGTHWGTGKSDRLRLTCDRGGAGLKELIPGGGPQSSFMHKEYMHELTNARFCPQPRGIAGKSNPTRFHIPHRLISLEFRADTPQDGHREYRTLSTQAVSQS